MSSSPDILKLPNKSEHNQEQGQQGNLFYNKTQIKLNQNLG